MAATNRLKKTFIASAILMFFTFGAFAMSMASDPSGEAALYSASSLQIGKEGRLRGAAPVRQTTPQCVSADIPRSVQPNFQPARVGHYRVVNQVTTAVFSEDHASKVSLQILHSVLNL